MTRRRRHVAPSGCWLALAATLILHAGGVATAQGQSLDSPETGQRAQQTGTIRQDPAADPYLQLVHTLDPYNLGREQLAPARAPRGMGSGNGRSASRATSEASPHGSTQRRTLSHDEPVDAIGMGEPAGAAPGDSSTTPAGLPAASVIAPLAGASGMAMPPVNPGGRAITAADPSALKSGACSYYVPGVHVTGLSMGNPSACP